MIAQLSEGTQTIDSALYGHKANWLAWLVENGFRVPKAIVLSYASAATIREPYVQGQLREALLSNGFDYDLNDLAVRSSATHEDGDQESLAGQFLTIAHRMTFNGLIESVERVRDSIDRNRQGGQMGVIVQEWIGAAEGGVIFSTNPFTMDSRQAYLSFATGSPEHLLSGKKAGSDLLIVQDSIGVQLRGGQEGIGNVPWQELWNIAKRIERNANRPMDIEWCTDNTGTLHVLQCRPITGRTLPIQGALRVSMENEDRIPRRVRGNSKVALRLRAERAGCLMSPAYLLASQREFEETFCADLGGIVSRTKSTSYSVVLVFPCLVEGKVQRRFTSYGGIGDVLSDLFSKSFVNYWDAVGVVQEVLDFEYTGVAKMVGNEIVIEAARGHFLPKGVVGVSAFILDRDCKVIYRNFVAQEHEYRISGKDVTIVQVPENEDALDETEGIVVSAARALLPFLRGAPLSTVLEFGVVTSNAEQGAMTFIIDQVEEDASASEFATDHLEAGIVSEGSAEGVLVRVKMGDSDDATNLHYHDSTTGSIETSVGTILACERPDISLMHTLCACPTGSVGVVFQEGSFLSHLSIVLREKGIPAMVIKDLDALPYGERCRLRCLLPTPFLETVDEGETS